MKYLLNISRRESDGSTKVKGMGSNRPYGVLFEIEILEEVGKGRGKTRAGRAKLVLESKPHGLCLSIQKTGQERRWTVPLSQHDSTQ